MLYMAASTIVCHYVDDLLECMIVCSHVLASHKTNIADVNIAAAGLVVMGSNILLVS